MKKICFVLTASNGLSYTTLSPAFFFADYSELKNYFANDYDVSINYFRDKDQVDYLVVPDPFVPFDNENDLPIINVPANYFVTKDYQQIKKTLAAFFINNP
ncbi:MULTISPECIES: hypothetical protein [Enterococcus]|uniref:hypothetical protein n=1 Tax=Enterococcus TaxID=1350 RepID=UPI0010FF6CF5|nr:MULTISPECIES: hypothetical protein [Enterococcus]QCT92461.1 hypothetical protein FE005_11200 [Enterococcus sp. M190262]GMG58544.1 hypothetical protein AH4_19530 [Enterococcus gallinarum]